MENTIKELVIKYPDIEVDEKSEFTEGVIRSVNRTLSIKVNTGDFENSSVSSSLTMDLKKNADIDKAIQQLDKKNAESLKPHIKALQAERKKKVDY